MTDFAHGATRTVQMEILNVGQSINKFGKLSIKVAPVFPYENQVIMLTAEHLDNLAEKVGANNRFVLSQAINACPNDPCFIVVNCTFKKEGEQIGLDADGNPIVSKSGHITHQKSYWDTELEGILLGAEAGDYTKSIIAGALQQTVADQMKASKDAAMDARRRRLGLNKAPISGTASNETPVVEESTADDDVI